MVAPAELRAFRPHLVSRAAPNDILCLGRRRTFRLCPRRKRAVHAQPCHDRTRALPWQPEPRACPTVLLLHGLEGSSDARYMKGIAEKAFRRGFNAVRLNQRNCGETDHLSEVSTTRGWPRTRAASYAN